MNATFTAGLLTPVQSDITLLLCSGGFSSNIFFIDNFAGLLSVSQSCNSLCVNAAGSFAPYV